MATLTLESNDSMESFGVVSWWLRDAGTSAVSGFASLHIVDLYRFDLDVITSMAGSNGPIQMFRVVWRWLRDVLV